MSGNDIPYQLRPNKFIDRQLFLEALSRLIAGRVPEKYIYASMGGRHLVDHHAIYNQIGIEALFSFDISKNEIARQNFNRPTGTTVCEEMNSKNLPGAIDGLFERFVGTENIIVWLDYTNAHGRRSQLQEAEQTLAQLKNGDLFRITFNADHRTIDDPNWKKNGFNSRAEARAENLRKQIGTLLPTNVVAITDNEIDLPLALSRSVELAAQSAQKGHPSLAFKPILITSYADGMRMMTVTLAVSETNSPEQFPPVSFAKWGFASKNFSDIRTISSPVLSPRERYRLNEFLHETPKAMLDALKFLPAETEVESLAALASYRSFHRYYPSFHNVED